MSVNSFLNNVGANGAKMLTPALIVELQNQTNYAYNFLVQSQEKLVCCLRHPTSELFVNHRLLSRFNIAIALSTSASERVLCQSG